MSPAGLRVLVIVVAGSLALFPAPGRADTLVNVALNPSATGFPSPLQSDTGWGGGSYPWDIVDGLHTYADWAHGLAFTGGHTGGAGSGGYIEPCGPRQATIDFGSQKRFTKILLWHHRISEMAPAVFQLSFWDGVDWRRIAAQRTYAAVIDDTHGNGWSGSDEYVFDEVRASKVSYGFDNCGDTVNGAPITHGWIYEFEVLGARVGVDLALDGREAANGWYATGPVRGTVTASTQDGGMVAALECTGVTLGSRSGLGTSSAHAAFELSADGTHHFSCSAADEQGDTSSPVAREIRLDTGPPAVTCNTPVPEFTRGGSGGSVTASVTDALSGAVDTAVSADADVATAGDRSVELAGTDQAGNRTVVACPYRVIATAAASTATPEPVARKLEATVPTEVARRSRPAQPAVSRFVTVSVRNGFRLPPGVAAKPACAANVHLELLRGKTRLARKTVALRRQGRTCRFRADLKVLRSKLARAKTLRCVITYRGTPGLGARTWSVRVKLSA
jgi:hypothetical protein